MPLTAESLCAGISHRSPKKLMIHSCLFKASLVPGALSRNLSMHSMHCSGMPRSSHRLSNVTIHELTLDNCYWYLRVCQWLFFFCSGMPCISHRFSVHRRRWLSTWQVCCRPIARLQQVYGQHSANIRQAHGRFMASLLAGSLLVYCRLVACLFRVCCRLMAGSWQACARGIAGSLHADYNNQWKSMMSRCSRNKWFPMKNE